jgi:hemolysin activation/secretion protein
MRFTRAVKVTGTGCRRGAFPHIVAMASGGVMSLGVVAGALAQPGDKPISRPATPPSAQPATQPAGQMTPPVDGERPIVTATFDDGRSYPVSRFVVKYLYPHPQHPAIAELEKTEVELGQTPEGFVRPRPGIPTVKVRLADLADGPVEVFRGSAMDAVIDAVLKRLNTLGVVGVYVFVSPDDVQVTEDRANPDFGRDLRPVGKTTMKLEVFTGTVSKVRTLANGQRIAPAARIDHPAHKVIRERSPVQPAAAPDSPERNDLIRKNEIDDYTHRLNRQPGRHVDVALSTGEDVEVEGGAKVPSVSLDYMVSENKPWTLYAQVSNTGTDETEVWRERFGFVHNQLTGRDDILALDYITGGFQDSHAFIGSYDTPLFGSEHLRGRVFGTWSEYQASDVGIADGNFSGDSFSAGGELAWNIYQHHQFFIDLIGGVKWYNVEVTNDLAGTSGEDDFFLPYIGLRMERYTDTASTSAMVNFETNLPSIAGTDSDLNALGRNGADDDWVAMQWDVNQSFFLEPLIARTAWLDPNSRGATLAHEISLSFKGQYAFDARLVPNFEQVAGGLYTVRGYPESAAAGDGVIIGSAEYRFHLPRALQWKAEPGSLFGQPFRWRPQQPYGSADWDLVCKAFFDVGRTIISDSATAEPEETLMGTGIGVEFIFKRNFNLRADWGFVLNRLESDDVDVGDSRFHILATILF